MPETEIRPHIVALLCDADWKYRPDTNTWSHRDGRPFTKEEQATAFQAVRAEVEEAVGQRRRYLEYLRKKENALEDLRQFLAPFMEQLAKKTLGNAVELMTEDERAEFDRRLRFMIEPVRPFTPHTF
ncbi:hypothetical protein ACFV7Q_25460 [Streptomyces sp. NPDC059851]|uniref:hypothetical protein n=1 Tax=Streptomyces sp. NPDC059851 TaxID=3346971 RepID=UPI003665F952